MNIARIYNSSVGKHVNSLHLFQRVKSRREHAITTTTGGIGVLDTGEGGVVTTISFVSIDVIKRRRFQTLI